MMKLYMRVLGIETSCDETACAVVEEGRTIRSNCISSSLKEHRPYGGVVPEIACRSHLESILPVVDQALQDSGLGFRDLHLVAATDGPGLAGALLVGVTVAKTISFSQGIPFVGVNHLHAHLAASLMGETSSPFPLLGLVVSGGHTALYEISDYDHFCLVGQTHDDACGEAFDKVAKILGLGYPGGPVIEARAREGNRRAFSFPSPLLKDHPFDFSFSGLKTAVLYKARELERAQSSVHSAQKGKIRIEGERQGVEKGFSELYALSPEPSQLSSELCALSPVVINDLCASFQGVVVDALVERSLQACRHLGLRRLIVGGGVIANQALRAALEGRFRAEGLRVTFPPRALSLDNAAMVAGLGYHLYRNR